MRVCSFRRTVVRHGTQWRRPLPVRQPPAIAFDPSDNDTVYLALVDGWSVNGQFWVTEDYGQTWIDRSAALPGEIVNDIVHDSNRILVAGGTEFTPDPFGVFESTDRGLTWNALHDATWPSLSINDIEIAPNNPSAILLGTTDHGVFSSSDGGTSWSFTARSCR